MSSKITIQHFWDEEERTGFHLFSDCLDKLNMNSNQPVYLELEGIDFTVASSGNVKVCIPHDWAIKLGLMPAESKVGEASSSVTVGSINDIAAKHAKFDISLEQYEARLKSKEEQIHAELEHRRATNKDQLLHLDIELTDIQANLKMPAVALEAYKNILADADRALDDVTPELPPNLLFHAKKALTKGLTGDAEKFFEMVYLQSKEKTAAAAYQLAQLSLVNIDYGSAYMYFKEAADVKPNSLNYLGTKAVSGD